jgi:hypothetical protein
VSKSVNDSEFWNYEKEPPTKRVIQIHVRKQNEDIMDPLTFLKTLLFETRLRTQHVKTMLLFITDDRFNSGEKRRILRGWQLVLAEVEEEAMKMRMTMDNWSGNDEKREEEEYLKASYGKMNAKIVNDDGKNGVQIKIGKKDYEDTDDEQDDEFERNKRRKLMYHGVKQYKNGARYTGLLANGRREGRGKMIYPKGNSIKEYEGDWHNDRWHGTGITISETNVRYEGEFLNGKRKGEEEKSNMNKN